jgi:predicted DNA-binding transcriptional regulator YafY
MSYRRWAAPQEVSRTLEPYGVVLKAGRWYLVAGGTKGTRTYRVSQILGIQVLQGRFDRPEGFDLAGHWAAYLDEFEVRRYRGEAVLRLSPQILERLPDLLEPAVARAARASAQPPEADGRIRVVIPIESVEHAAGTLLRLGADAEVLAPTALRENIAGAISALAEIYQIRSTAD